MSEEVTSQIQPIDWTWANERLTLPIYNAVSLSLGYEINALAPVDQAWVRRPFVQPPEDYKQRVATTYEAVRMGMLSCHTTTKNGATFDLAAKFSDAQFWEVSTVEFRRFCDERGWQVPTDFLPNGYISTVLATGLDNATPASRANSASNALDISKGTPPKLTEADKAEILRLYNRGRGASVNAMAKQFNVSRPTIEKVLQRAGIKK